MSEEKMRSEFEAAAEEHFWLQDLSRDYDKAEQEYLDEIVQTAWEFWNLSREAFQAECEKLRKDAERYRYIKKGNQWIVAATQTGFQLDGEELDYLLDSEMEQ